MATMPDVLSLQNSVTSEGGIELRDGVVAAVPARQHLNSRDSSWFSGWFCDVVPIPQPPMAMAARTTAAAAAVCAAVQLLCRAPLHAGWCRSVADGVDPPRATSTPAHSSGRRGAVSVLGGAAAAASGESSRTVVAL
jgi:hypothetical protein